MDEIFGKSFVGESYLACRQAYEKFIEDGHFALSGQGGDHFCEIDRIWTEFLGISRLNPNTHTLHRLSVLYKVEFRLNDESM